MGLAVRFWGRGVVALLICGGSGGQTGSPISFIYTRTPCYDREVAIKRGERFPEGATLRVIVKGSERDLAPGFAASADAAVSFDGTRVLFSGKQKSGDRWRVWEVPIAGGTPRRITAFQEDGIAPFYVAEERIVYARRTPTGFQLETSFLNGSVPNRLTYGPGDHVPTAVLRDGRVLFDAPHPGSVRGRDVYAVYTDGSGVETYRCDHGRDRHSGVETLSGDVVFESGGQLAHFTSARAAQVPLPPIKGEFAGPIAEASPGVWLVSYRDDPGRQFGIHVWRPGQAAPEATIVAKDAMAVQPVLLRPHEVPKRHPSSLGDREGANLLCLSVYTSKMHIAAGSVTSVRVWALEDRGAVVLGEAKVERDGSFFVQTPSERAMRFELLDRAGKTVAEEKGWFWARRGEQRVCVGCHAGPERAPENAVPETLVRSTIPTRMIPSLPQTRGAK